MTCIVGLVEDGITYIAGDSAGSNSYVMRPRADRKVFRKGSFLFGCAGSFRMAQLLKYNLDIPVRNGATPPDRYIHTAFLDAIRVTMWQGGHSQQVLGEELIAGAVIFSYQGGLYSLEPDYQIAELSVPFMAIGCGAQVALGSLHSTDGMKPTERVRMALEASEQYTQGVRRPFILLSDLPDAPPEGVELQASSQVYPIDAFLNVLAMQLKL